MARRKKRGRQGNGNRKRQVDGRRKCSVCSHSYPPSSFSQQEWSRPASCRCCNDCTDAAMFGTPAKRAEGNKMLGELFSLHEALVKRRWAERVGRTLSTVSGQLTGEVMVLPCGHFGWVPQVVVGNGRCPFGCSSFENRVAGDACTAIASPIVFLGEDGLEHELARWNLRGLLDAVLATDGGAEAVAELATIRVSHADTVRLATFDYGTSPRQAFTALSQSIAEGMAADCASMSAFGVMVVHKRCSAWLSGNVYFRSRSDSGSAVWPPHDIIPHVATLVKRYEAAERAVTATPKSSSLFFAESADLVTVRFSYANIAATPPAEYVGAGLVGTFPVDYPLAALFDYMVGKFVVSANVRIPNSLMVKWADPRERSVLLEVFTPAADSADGDACSLTHDWVRDVDSATVGSVRDALTAPLARSLNNLHRRSIVFSFAPLTPSFRDAARLVLDLTPADTACLTGVPHE